MLIGAVEAGGTKFVLGIGNEKGEILERLSIPTETPEITMEKVVEFFKGKEVEAIGVGCFGPIDPKLDSPTYGYITTTPKVKWANYNIIGELKKYFDVPIAFDTDVNGATLGELTWGEAKGLNSALCITVGTGIGAGAIVEGKMIHQDEPESKNKHQPEKMVTLIPTKPDKQHQHIATENDAI